MVKRFFRSIKSYFLDIKSWLKAEWILLLGCIIFILVLGWGIFKWQHIALFIITLIVGRVKVGKFYLNMSFGTFLVIVGLSFTAVSFQRQSELIKMQMDQLSQEAKMVRINKTAQWQELKDSISKFFDLNIGSVDKFVTLPAEERIAFFRKTKEILYSQMKNPVLIEDVKCLTLWRNAINVAQYGERFLNIPDLAKNEDISRVYFTDIFKDIGTVWAIVNPATENFNNRIY